MARDQCEGQSENDVIRKGKNPWRIVFDSKSSTARFAPLCAPHHGVFVGYFNLKYLSCIAYSVVFSFLDVNRKTVDFVIVTLFVLDLSNQRKFSPGCTITCLPDHWVVV